MLALPSGDVARLVRGRDVQVCAAQTGEVTELSMAAFRRRRWDCRAPGVSWPDRTLTMSGRRSGHIVDHVGKPGPMLLTPSISRSIDGASVQEDSWDQQFAP